MQCACNTEIFAGSEPQVHPKMYLCLAHSIWCGLVPSWATRRLVGLPGSLRLQNSPLTSHWPKHNPGVTLLYTLQVCSSGDEAENQVQRRGRGRCLCCFQHVQEQEGVIRAGGGQAPSPLPVYIRGQWQGQGLLESAREDRSTLSSCPTWKGWTLGLTKQPPLTACEASRKTPSKLHPRRTTGTAESLYAQMETTRNVTFFLDIYVF